MTEAEDAESKTDTDDESNSSEYDQTVDKPTSANTQKDLAAASKAINAAMYDFEVSNDTTRDDILKMAKDAISEQNAISVSLNSSDFTIIKASTTLFSPDMTCTRGQIVTFLFRAIK